MKQYEKWLKGKAGIGWYTGTEGGWRAALEWALNGEEDYCSFNKCVTADRIGEELEE